MLCFYLFMMLYNLYTMDLIYEFTCIISDLTTAQAKIFELSQILEKLQTLSANIVAQEETVLEVRTLNHQLIFSTKMYFLKVPYSSK